MSVYPVPDLNFECFELERLLFYAGISVEYLVQVCISMSLGQGHRIASNKVCLCFLFVGGLPSIGRQSCSDFFLIRVFKL